MTDLRYLMLFLALFFVGHTMAQISYAEFDDLYFDGVEQPKKMSKIVSDQVGDEEVVDETVVENNYRKYKAGDNYDPYDYEYTSRVRRFYDAAPGFSYYSDYYVDNFYYDPYYFGTSIYMNQSPSYWNNYGHRPYWDRYGNRGFNAWGPTRGWGGYGSQAFWSGSSYYNNYYNGWSSYNSPYGNPFCSPFNNPYSWNSWNNGGFNNNWYGQSIFNQVASTPAAGNYLSARYNRGSNTSRTGSLHRSTQPQVRPAVYHNRMNMSGQQRGSSYSRSSDPKQNRSGTRTYNRDQQSSQSTRSYNSGTTTRSNSGYGRSSNTQSNPSRSSYGSYDNRQRGNNSSSYSRSSQPTRSSQSSRSSGGNTQQRSSSRSSNRSGRPR